jgi:uncharacterized protein (DUF58 family)
VPTRAGWLLVAGAAACLAAGRLLGVLELFVLGATGLVLVAAAVAWVRRPAPPLVVDRVVAPPQVPLGEPARAEVRVANPSGRPVPPVLLVDPVEGTIGARLRSPELAAGSSRVLGYRLPTGERGRLAVGPMRLVLTDPFGLARRTLPAAPAASVTVLPRLEAIAGVRGAAGIDDLVEHGRRPAAAAAATEDLAALRPYVVGDDLRRVHWRSSARHADLIVRQDEEHHQGLTTIWLDRRRGRLDEDGFERAVSAAASLVHAIALAGDRVRVIDSTGADSGLVDARSHRGVLLEHLALATRHQDDRWHPPAHVGSGAGRVIALTGPAGATDDLAAALAGARAVTVVAFGEPDGVPAATPGPRPPGPRWDAIAVGPRERFAAVWSQAERERRR